eukprot:s149_g32.t1
MDVGQLIQHAFGVLPLRAQLAFPGCWRRPCHSLGEGTTILRDTHEALLELPDRSRHVVQQGEFAAFKAVWANEMPCGSSTATLVHDASSYASQIRKHSQDGNPANSAYRVWMRDCHCACEVMMLAVLR